MNRSGELAAPAPVDFAAEALGLQGVYQRWLIRALNDPRDHVFVTLSLWITAVQLPCAVMLLALERFSWWLAFGYWLLWGVLFMDRYILMLHCTSHRPLFRRSHGWLNHYIPAVLGPFCGETPHTYFGHHLGMHHKEGNGPADLSSTLPYQRDSVRHWLVYCTRFLLVGLPELVRYLRTARRARLGRRVFWGEVTFWLGVVALGYGLSWQGVLVVFVAPVLLVRLLMMTGNWSQHAFVDPTDVLNPYKNSINCINTRYNARCFNDGYHIVHHLRPALHYSEMPAAFEANREVYGKQDAIVFDGIDFFAVWALLMTGRWKRLEQAFVRLPGAPERSEAEVIEFLQRRLGPVGSRRARAVA